MASVTHREWNHTDKKAPCPRGGFNLGSAPCTDHRDESDQKAPPGLAFCPEEKAGEQEASHYAHKGLEDQSERPRFVFQNNNNNSNKTKKLAHTKI